MILAHAFGQRYTLPLPLLLFVFGGAAVVVVSFMLVLPRAVTPLERHDGADHVALEPRRPLLDAMSVVVLTALIACGIGGSQEVPENLLPTAFWLVVWVAVPLSCGVLGDWSRPVNPYRALARAADSPRLRRLLFGSPEPVGWPSWLSWWPAVGTFLVLVGGELVFNASATVPRVIAYGLLVAALASVAMGLLVVPPTHGSTAVKSSPCCSRRGGGWASGASVPGDGAGMPAAWRCLSRQGCRESCSS